MRDIRTQWLVSSRLVSLSTSVNSTLHRAHITHASLFSRVAQPCELHLFVCHLERVILMSGCHFSHLPRSRTFLIAARHSDLFLPALSLSEDKSQRTASRTLLWPFFFRTDPAHNFHHLAVTTKHLIHRQQDCLVVWPYNVRLQVYKPNAIVEIGSAEVTSIHRPSRRTSFCSVHKAGEDVTSARVSSEVAERQSIGRLAPTDAHAEERSKCNPCQHLSLSMIIFHVTLITHSKHGETCSNTLTQTEVEQRHKKRTGKTSYK